MSYIDVLRLTKKNSLIHSLFYVFPSSFSVYSFFSSLYSKPSYEFINILIYCIRWQEHKSPIVLRFLSFVYVHMTVEQSTVINITEGIKFWKFYFSFDSINECKRIWFQLFDITIVVNLLTICSNSDAFKVKERVMNVLENKDNRLTR